VTFELLIFLAGSVLILSTSTFQVLVAYVVIAASVDVVAAQASLSAPLTLAFFATAFLLKAVVVPIGIWTFARRNPTARSLRPAAGLPLRLIVVLVLAFASGYVSGWPGLATAPLAAIVADIVLCGMAMLVIHRNLLAQVIGLLVLGTGVTLAGAAFAPQLPEAVELGAAFDAMVVTFIGLALVRAVLTDNPLLDTESLRSLRG
jgi:hydrogenase-4 membrane subunit HyfE